MAEEEKEVGDANTGSAQNQNDQKKDAGAAGGGAAADAGGAGANAAGGGGNGNGNDGGGNGNGGGGDGKADAGPQTFWEWMRTPPGDRLVGSGAIILTTAFLMALTVSLLIGITVTWPACDFPANDNTNTNSNSNASNANANANTNTASASPTQPARQPSPSPSPAASPAASPSASPSPAASPAQTPTPLADIDVIEPKTGSVLGNTSVTIKGKNLRPQEGLTVKFGEDEVKLADVKDTTISVRTPRHSEGVVDVSIWRKVKGADGKDEQVEQDRLTNAYTYVCAAPQGSTLFWMLIMAGALGGCIHALRSLWWYTGQGNLRWKWMFMYFCLPFTGAAMAMLFSLLIVAGIIDSTSGRSESLFIIAIAGLVGMFTQQAALKLTDIANAVFARPEEGKNANPQAALPATGGGGGAGGVGGATPTINPSSGPAAGGQAVSITGTGLTDVASVTFGTLPASGFKFNTVKASIDGVTPQNPAGAGTVTVTVKNKAGASATVPYKYT